MHPYLQFYLVEYSRFHESWTRDITTFLDTSTVLIKLNQENIIMSEPTNLCAAIDFQLQHRVSYDAAGNMLCRRCNQVVPEEFRFVLNLPGNNDTVWGPCCSEECLCYLKICSHCNKDYIVDREEEIKYQGDGVWLCHECLAHLETCSECGKVRPLVDAPTGKVCKGCFDKKFFTCTTCNQVHHIDNMQTENRAQYTQVFELEVKVCKGCFTSKTTGIKPLQVKQCDYCDKVFTFKRDTGHNFCPDCIRARNVIKCDGCDKYTKNWDSRGNKCFCRSCQASLVRCSSCEQWDVAKKFTKIKGTVAPHFLCSSCIDQTKGYKECSVCFKYGIVEGDGKEGCSNCKQKTKYCTKCGKFHFGENKCRKIMYKEMDYGYKPMPFFNYISNTRVFFGFENEINYNDETDYELAVRGIYDNYTSTDLYIKRDGSIEGKGFEAVSQPMTKEYFDKKFETEHLFAITPKLKDSSCGLHVHISKGSFDGQVHLFKFIEFINSITNKTFIKKVAGRDFNSYAKAYQEKISKAVKGDASRERYHAVNLTNSATYEVRIFKGAKTNEELRYRIEFVLALIEFTRTSSIQDVKDVEVFKRYVKNHKGEYKFLAEFLK